MTIAKLRGETNAPPPLAQSCPRKVGSLYYSPAIRCLAVTPSDFDSAFKPTRPKGGSKLSSSTSEKIISGRGIVDAAPRPEKFFGSRLRIFRPAQRRVGNIT